jgi:hypothetical protein
MWYWHSPVATTAGVISAVCLAGTVMAKSLSSDITSALTPSHLGEVLELKLYALQSFRLGSVERGLSFMDLGGIDGLNIPDRVHAKYSEDPTLFKRQLHTLANELESKSL